MLRRELSMPRKPIELPLAVARRLVQGMRAYFSESNSSKRDEIAARQPTRSGSTIPASFALPTWPKCLC